MNNYYSSGQTITLDKVFEPIDLTSTTSIFEDQSNLLTIADVNKMGFLAYNLKDFVIPFSNHTFWIKVSLKNIDVKNKDWVMVWENALVEKVNFYFPKADGSYVVQKKGALIAKSIINPPSYVPTAHFQIFDNKTHDYYIEIKSQRGNLANLLLMPASHFTDYNLDEVKLSGFLDGISILRLLYLLILGLFVVKETVFRHYSILVIVRTLAFWGILGRLGNTFTQNPNIALQINQQLYYIMPIGYALICFTFLDIKRFPKYVPIMLKSIISITTIVCIAILFDYNWYWLKAATFLIAFSIMIVLVLHTISFFKKYKVKWLYSIPLLLAISSNLYIPVRLLGFHSFPGSSIFSMLCYIAEIVLFVLFLGKIINNYEKKKIISENELLFSQESTKKLTELDQIKTTFFANISHEFRTPLTLIIGPIEDLISENPAKNAYHIISRNAKRLLELINQILDISKLETGQVKLEIHQYELVSHFRTLTSAFQSLAESKNISFEVNQNKEKAVGFIDNDKTEKIVINLLSNAFKFTNNGGKVKFQINYSLNNNWMEIIVTDTGIGVSKSNISNIFNRFYQVDDSQDRKFEGSGIGLALVKELVIVLKGTIKAESEVGIGTTFKLNIPISQNAWEMELGTMDNYVSNAKKANLSAFSENILPVANLEESQNEFRNSDDEKILLIVEDNQDIRNYIKSIFKNEYKIIEGHNGEAGIKLAIENIPDIIISDLMMPKLGGIEFCKTIKNNEKTSHIPIILLTAKANIESKIEGLGFGADDYLTKPFNAEELVSRVRNLVVIREQLKQKYSEIIVDLKPTQIKVDSVDEKFLTKALQIVNNNLENSSFNVESFAAKMNMSNVQLRRKIKALTSFTALEFVRNHRLQVAANLLQNKSGNISEIAYQVGFESLTYFGRMFQEKYGITPTDYRKQN